MSFAVVPRANEETPNLAVEIRLARAKHLLAQELPMMTVAKDVGLSVSRIQAAATEGNWLRRSRRNPYTAEIRVEALKAHEQTGSMTKAARLLGIGRTTLTRWLRATVPGRKKAIIRWRCYDCAPYGAMVEGSTCPGCGVVRAWDETDEET